MPSEVILICGAPASGKSTHTQEFVKQGYICLNRDTDGGSVADLLPKLTAHLLQGKKVVLDNLFPTAESRKPFIAACKSQNIPIRCVYIDIAIEDAQINALHRMWNKHQRLFCHPEDLKQLKVKDPNIFPVAVLFKYRKELEKPAITEGFSKVDVIKFVRRPLSAEYCNKALILDYDGNLRDSTGEKDYPFKPSEIKMLPGRKEKIQPYIDKGYLILGVSNQSGIAKGLLSYQDAVDCFEETNRLLGINIDYVFCPHQSTPPVCYCRKPQSGNGVYLIEKYKLNPKECIFVGDLKTDETFAKRLGFKYFHTDVFFK